MMMVLAVVALVLLAWIALALERLVRIARTTQGEMRLVSTFPDSQHPAFSQKQIQTMLSLLDGCAVRSDQLQTELYQTTEWLNQPSGYAPSPDAENKMRDICRENAYWHGALRKSQFMIEANLMVQRGELTIAEARRLYDDHESFPSVGPLFGSGEPEFKEFKERLATRAAFQDKRTETDTRLKQLMQGWKGTFERYKLYPPSKGSKRGGPERWFG